MFEGIRGSEFLIILFVAMLLFGARRLPELARSLGASAKEFRRGLSEGSIPDGPAGTEEEPKTG